MKKLIVLFLVLGGILVAGLIALPMLLDPNQYKPHIAKMVKDTTGRDLVMNGNIGLKVFPNIALSVEQVSLSSPAGYTAKTLLTADVLQVGVRLKPLLDKRLEVTELALKKPVINLEVNAAGKPNWEFSALPAPLRAGRAEGLISAAWAAEGLQELSLERLKVDDGTVNFTDMQKKSSFGVKELKADVKMSGSGMPVKGEASAKWNNEPVEVKLDIASLQALMEGKASKLDVNISSAAVKLKAVLAGTRDALKGNAEVSIPSVPKLMAWTGSPMEWKATPLSVKMVGPLECSQTRCMMTNGEYAVDVMQFKGALGADWGGAKPELAAKLATGLLDLRPYMQSKQAWLFDIITPAYAAQPWSNEPLLPLDALKAMNAKVQLAAEGVKLAKLTLGKTALNANLAGGVLNLDVPSAELYGGMVSSKLVVDANAQSLSKQAQISGVQAEPMLKESMEFNKLTGTLAMNANIHGSATSMAALMRSMNGSGNISVTDGAIKGIDIPGMVRNVKSAFTNTDSAAQKTDFSELAGSFTIVSGLLSNKDLRMKAPLLRMTGEGTVNLPVQRVNYVLKPEVVGSLKGQGGKDKEGLGVPVIVEGTFDQLTFRPDLKTVLEDLKDPEKRKETIENVKEQIKGGKEALKELKNDPQALDNLLKGLR